MKTISPYQAAAMMLCFSLSRLISFKPSGDNLLICAAGELLAGAALAAVSVALPEKLSIKGRLIPKLCAALSAAYLLLQLTLLLSDLAASTQYSFPDFYASPAMIASAAAAAAYCASMGKGGCGRAACAVIVITLIIFVLTAVGAADRFDPDRLSLAVPDRAQQLSRQLLYSLGTACEIPLALILRQSTDRPRRAALLWFSGHSLSWAAMLTLCAGVIGDHALTGIPIDTLSSYSKTSVIERFDALLLLVWVLCTVLAAAALLSGTGCCIKIISDKAGRFAPPIGALISGTAACLLTGQGVLLPASVMAALLGGAMLLGFGAKEVRGC